MNLTTLKDTPPWEWPEGTPATLLGILRDDRASTSDVLLAAELAGDVAVINTELVDVLLSLLHRGDTPETPEELSTCSSAGQPTAEVRPFERCTITTC